MKKSILSGLCLVLLMPEFERERPYLHKCHTGHRCPPGIFERLNKHTRVLTLILKDTSTKSVFGDRVVGRISAQYTDGYFACIGRFFEGSTLANGHLYTQRLILQKSKSDNCVRSYMALICIPDYCSSHTIYTMQYNPQ